MAFVVPSSAATSASGRACAISSRTSRGRHVREVGREHDDALRRRRAARARAPRCRRGRGRRRRARRRRARARRRAPRGRARRRRPASPASRQAPTTRRSRNSTRSLRASASSTSARRDLPRGQRLHGHQRQPPAMGTGYHRAESMSPSSALPPLRLGYKASAEQFAPARPALVRRRGRAPRARQRRRLGSLPALPARRRALAGIAAVARARWPRRPRASSSARAC